VPILIFARIGNSYDCEPENHPVSTPKSALFSHISYALLARCLDELISKAGKKFWYLAALLGIRSPAFWKTDAGK